MYGGEAVGADLAAASFNALLGGEWGGKGIALASMLFAGSSILGWCYYGEKALEYLGMREVGIWGYRVLFAAVCYVGVESAAEGVWAVSDCMNALMAGPNLLALFLLSGEVREMTRAFFEDGRQVKKRR